MRSLRNRSLLEVNEDFEGKRNAEVRFLFSSNAKIVIFLFLDPQPLKEFNLNKLYYKKQLHLRGQVQLSGIVNY